jgi:hypothetical protein
LNFTMTATATQGSRWSGLVLAALLLVACGRASSVPPPASPEAVVRGFLDAVRANSLARMGELWGSARGPARGYMRHDELEQRLTIIRTYLQNDKFEMLESQGVPSASGNERTVRVRLERNGCAPVVPFTVVPYAGGWLISNIDLAQAGNPARHCKPGPGPGAGR